MSDKSGAGGSGSGAGGGGSGSGAGGGGSGLSTIDWKGLRRLRITAVVRNTKAGSTGTGKGKLRNFCVTPFDFERFDQRKMVMVETWATYQRADTGHTPQKIHRCRVSGLFYVGPYRWDKSKVPDDPERYWEERARRQYGSHLYTAASGPLAMVSHLLRERDKFYVTKQAPINQLYPCVRLEVNTTPGKHVDGAALKSQQVGNQETWWNYGDKRTLYTYYGQYWLCTGLVFARFDAADYLRTGDRYYVRHPGLYFKTHTWGGVKELTDNNEEQFVSDEIPNMPVRFALYVCAGAKLIVMDRYGEKVEPAGSGHNRTLVQAGGVVVVQGQLELMAPEYWPKDIGEYRTFQLKDYDKAKGDPTKEKCLLSDKGWAKKLATKHVDTESDEVLEALAKYDCPVLFLGANESEYGSIAWLLNIDIPIAKARTPTAEIVDCENRRCFLVIPQGGRFEAIEDWDTTQGWEEVRARHRYERLHEATVEMDLTRFTKDRFAVPAEPMMQKILGIGTDRTIYTNIWLMSRRFHHQLDRPRNQTPLPVVYNSYKCTEWPSRQRNDKLRPFARPDWPLVQFRGSADTEPRYRKVEAGCMSTGLELEHINRDNLEYPSDRLYLLTSAGQKEDYTVAANQYPLGVYQYERQPYGRWLTADYFDGQKRYVGMDGCHYKKIGAQPVGDYNALYYTYEGAPEVTATKSKDTKRDGKAMESTSGAGAAQPKGATGGPPAKRIRPTCFDPEEQEPFPLGVFEYERLPYDQWLTKEHFDGVNAYIGVDGCVYRKTPGAKPIGEYKALYYGYEGAPEVTATKSKDTKSKPKGKTGGPSAAKPSKPSCFDSDEQLSN